MRIIAFLLSLLAFATPATAQFGGGEAERRYSVTDFDTIRLDGGLRIGVSTGRSPFATARGDRNAIDGLVIRVEGRTLTVRMDPGNWSGYPGEERGPVTIEVGTHDLRQVWVNGAGAVDIDRVEGLEFGLTVAGSGSAQIADIQVDRLNLALAGAASATVAGKVEDATIIVRGVSSLQGAGLVTDDLTLGVDGAGLVRLGTTREAEVDAIGPGDITLGGRPACTVRVNGVAVVRGCS